MRIKHPTLPDDQVAEVSEEAFISVWQPRGWLDAGEVPDPKLAVPVVDIDGDGEHELVPYDPAQHTVDEVNAYLEEFDPEIPEAAAAITAVLETEAQGLNRKGIVAGPHATAG